MSTTHPLIQFLGELPQFFLAPFSGLAIHMGSGAFVSQHAFVKEPRHSVSLKFPGQAKDHVIIVPAARYAEMQLQEAIRLGYDAETGRRQLDESLAAFQQWHE